jgi:hypothetical protein
VLAYHGQRPATDERDPRGISSRARHRGPRLARSPPRWFRRSSTPAASCPLGTIRGGRWGLLRVVLAKSPDFQRPGLVQAHLLVLEPARSRAPCRRLSLLLRSGGTMCPLPRGGRVGVRRPRLPHQPSASSPPLRRCHPPGSLSAPNLGAHGPGARHGSPLLRLAAGGWAGLGSALSWDRRLRYGQRRDAAVGDPRAAAPCTQTLPLTALSIVNHARPPRRAARRSPMWPARSACHRHKSAAGW